MRCPQARRSVHPGRGSTELLATGASSSLFFPSNLCSQRTAELYSPSAGPGKLCQDEVMDPSTTGFGVNPPLAARKPRTCAVRLPDMSQALSNACLGRITHCCLFHGFNSFFHNPAHRLVGNRFHIPQLHHRVRQQPRRPAGVTFGWFPATQARSGAPRIPRRPSSRIAPL